MREFLKEWWYPLASCGILIICCLASYDSGVKEGCPDLKERKEKREMPGKENPQDYLGDGVYVLFDGYGLELRANDHRNPVAIYLEPEVLEALNRFWIRCNTGGLVLTVQEMSDRIKAASDAIVNGEAGKRELVKEAEALGLKFENGKDPSVVPPVVEDSATETQAFIAVAQAAWEMLEEIKDPRHELTANALKSSIARLFVKGVKP